MQETRQPVRAYVELLGQYELLLCIETIAKDASGNSKLHIETSCLDSTHVEAERNRICDRLRLACVSWSMPEEALRINLVTPAEASEMAKKQRRSHADAVSGSRSEPSKNEGGDSNGQNKNNRKAA